MSLRILILLALLGSIPFASAQTTPAPTPPAPTGAMSGRPPMGALRRYDPKLYDVTFGVQVFTEIPMPDASLRQLISVRDAPVVLPLILRGPWSRMDPASLRGKLWVNGNENRAAESSLRLDPGKSFGMGYATMVLPEVTAQTIKFEYSWRMQSWSSALDESIAARATWPQTWPDECQDALKPQAFIESDDPRFVQFVEKVSEGKLRTVPIFYAAKDLIRATMKALLVDSDGIYRAEGGVLVGLEMRGAKWAMDQGRASPPDVVASCVAVLRAAGIPARPVVGISREIDAKARGEMLTTWAEFYLPDSGWVPFDPRDMRGAGLHRNAREVWPGFGTFDELNERIILAYAFHPPDGALISHAWPAIWGWDPRPNGAPRTTRQYVNVSTTGRGKGVEDPQ